MPVGIGAFKSQRLFRPEFVRRVFARRLQQDGEAVVLKDRKHQINREMWIGATFALGLMQAGNPPIYCSPGIPGDSPDVYGVSIGNDDKGQVAFLHHWEITEYNSFASAANVSDHLLETKMWKGYGPEFSIVCYAQREGQPFNPMEEHKRMAVGMKDRAYPAAWIMSPLESSTPGLHVIVQIWPAVTANQFVPEEIEQTLAKDMKEILKPSFGLGTGFTPLGEEEIRGWEDA